VKKAYEILIHNANVSGPHQHPPPPPPPFWKILHHAIPVKVELNRRGVHYAMACLLCNNAIETQDYLFLHCDLARAVWFGADIPIIHLTEATITVDIWVKDLLKQHNDLNNNTYDLQMILTLLWCIWFHRNQICLKGNNPIQLMEIILTSKSLLKRFLQTSSNNAGNTGWVRNIVHATSWTPDTNWQVLITTAGGAAKNGTRHGMTYMGKNRDGQVIFVGCKTTTTQDSKLARLIAIREAIIKAT
jgi:hypothetical protein